VTARLGGDEFALLLPAVDRTRALEVADAWCRACENGRHGTSLSTGLITVAGGRHQAAAVFGGADRALYAAKQSRSTVPVLAQL
jgi:GGDEF domain-containing protein